MVQDSFPNRGQGFQHYIDGAKASGRERRRVYVNRAMMVLTLAVLISGLFLQLSRMAAINARAIEISELNAQIVELTGERQQLEIVMSIKQDIARIQDEAARLGMTYPGEGQVRVVTLPTGYGADNTMVAADN